MQDQGRPKVSVIGVGAVGGTYAFSLMNSGMAREIVLVDRDRAKAESQSMDLNHCLSFTNPVNIHSGDFSDCRGSDLVVITAGTSQKPGQTRLDLVQKNTAIFRDIIPKIVEHSPDSIILVVTNPVDVLTYVTLRISGFDCSRVMGSGTVLDTSRFRYMIALRCKVDVRNVHAYMIGEHGDTELPVWSMANIGGVKLEKYCPLCGEGCRYRLEMEEILDEVRNSAYKIVEAKGSTSYAVALSMLKITSAILRDENSLLCVSSMMEEQYGVSEVCLGMPSVVNRSGVGQTLHLGLNDKERELFDKSARTIRDVIDSLEF